MRIDEVTIHFANLSFNLIAALCFIKLQCCLHGRQRLSQQQHINIAQIGQIIKMPHHRAGLMQHPTIRFYETVIMHNISRGNALNGFYFKVFKYALFLQMRNGTKKFIPHPES